MRITFNISALLFGTLVMMAFVSPQKKIDKIISKVWKDKEVTAIRKSVPDSLEQDIMMLSEVVSEGKTIGYVCYAMAFGCQIGGCAAPSSPNAQTYETFDYIVVYDNELKILKVDIADYGGQYGYEICRKKWLSQFRGKNGGFVLDGNIDGISGATISAKYLIDDLNLIGEKLLALDLSKLVAHKS